MHRSAQRYVFRIFYALLALITAQCFAAVVDYDIVYLRAPRLPDPARSDWPEVIHPTKMMPGTDLMLLHPNGAEEVLFPAGNGAVLDPVVSFDARFVYFAYFPEIGRAHV